MGLLKLALPARYALSGMLYLAHQPEHQFRLVEEAAAAEHLPKDFLAKIFQKLAHKGLLLSKRGPGGGYALARAAEAISIEEIVQCTDKGAHPEGQCFLENRDCDARCPCSVHDSVAKAAESLRAALKRMSLADLCRDADRYKASNLGRKIA